MRKLEGHLNQGLKETRTNNKSQQTWEEMKMTSLGQNIQMGSTNSIENSEVDSGNERGKEMLKTQKQNWFSRSLNNTFLIKLLTGLAVGAMLVTSIGMAKSWASADEPSRPLGNASIATLGFGHYHDMVQAAKLKISPAIEVYVPVSNTNFRVGEAEGFGHYHDMVQAARPKISQGTEVYVPVYNRVSRITEGFGHYDDMVQAANVKIDQSAKLGRSELGFYSYGSDFVTERLQETLLVDWP